MLAQKELQLLRDIAVGDGVDLQISTPTAPKRVRTRYVGMEEGQGLFFSVPTSAKWASTRDLLLPGNTIVIRHVLEGDSGTIVAFKVKVLRLLHNPLSVLITSFPESLQSRGLRAVKRGYPGIGVQATVEGHDPVNAIITDASVSGCRVAVKQQVMPEFDGNKILTLDYQLENKTLSINASVKNVTYENDYVYIGLQFDEKQDAVATLLERHILYYE